MYMFTISYGNIGSFVTSLMFHPLLVWFTKLENIGAITFLQPASPYPIYPMSQLQAVLVFLGISLQRASVASCS
jgi:hypothetical protein